MGSGHGCRPGVDGGSGGSQIGTEVVGARQIRWAGTTMGWNHVPLGERNHQMKHLALFRLGRHDGLLSCACVRPVPRPGPGYTEVLEERPDTAGGVMHSVRPRLPNVPDVNRAVARSSNSTPQLRPTFRVNSKKVIRTTPAITMPAALRGQCSSRSAGAGGRAAIQMPLEIRRETLRIRATPLWSQRERGAIDPQGVAESLAAGNSAEPRLKRPAARGARRLARRILYSYTGRATALQHRSPHVGLPVRIQQPIEKAANRVAPGGRGE